MPAAESAIGDLAPTHRSRLPRVLLLGFAFTVTVALALASW